MQKWLTLVLTLSLVVACTPLPTQGVSKATLPLDWPVSPPNKQQIASVRACDLESLAKERYPDAVKSDDLLASYAPKSGCDWAILALAYVMRLGEDEPLPESAKEAFTQAVSRNIAFALATPIFYWYFGTVPLVNAPAFAHREITDVRISYQWVGLGVGVNYYLEIDQANTNPTVNGAEAYAGSSAARTPIPVAHHVDKELVQALGPALCDLVPVNSQFSLLPCTDNLPRWSVSLTFADHRAIRLETDSNFLSAGGPWFAEIDRQEYVQFSPAFVRALASLTSSMGLPFGQPEGMYCSGDSVFDKAFPPTTEE